ncbi:MAG: 5-oxoprolinase subunit PxpA [Rhodomicrobiaceae bacterium]
MTTRVNLNADMGEGHGAYDIGADDALLSIVKSASIACGFHGGDFRTMHRLAKRAAEMGVSIGAHPGFNDLWGFGRRRITMPAQDVEYMVAYQIGALQALALYSGIRVTHVKVHGALNNMAAEDEGFAMAIGRAIKAVDPALIYVALTGSQMERATERLGLRLAREGFADRVYADDGNLASRSIPGTVLKDPAKAREQVLRMVQAREVVTISGKVIPVETDTICLHGDEPTAVAVGQEIVRGLKEAGIDNVPLTELDL